MAVQPFFIDKASGCCFIDTTTPVCFYLLKNKCSDLSVREAAADLEEDQDAAGTLTLEETQRRCQAQEEPAVPADAGGCSGSDDDSGSGSGDAAGSDSEDGTASDDSKDNAAGARASTSAEPVRGEKKRLPSRSPPSKKSRVDSKPTGGEASSPLPALLKRIEEIRSGALDDMTGRVLQRLLRDIGSEQANALKFRSSDEEEVKRVKDACGKLLKLLNILKVASKPNSTTSDWNTAADVAFELAKSSDTQVLSSKRWKSIAMKRQEFHCDQKRRVVSVVISFADYSVATAHSAEPGRLGHRSPLWSPRVIWRGLEPCWGYLGAVLSGLGAILGLVFN